MNFSGDRKEMLLYQQSHFFTINIYFRPNSFFLWVLKKKTSKYIKKNKIVTKEKYNEKNRKEEVNLE